MNKTYWVEIHLATELLVSFSSKDPIGVTMSRQEWERLGRPTGMTLEVTP